MIRGGPALPKAVSVVSQLQTDDGLTNTIQYQTVVHFGYDTREAANPSVVWGQEKEKKMWWRCLLKI